MKDSADAANKPVDTSSIDENIMVGEVITIVMVGWDSRNSCKWGDARRVPTRAAIYIKPEHVIVIKHAEGFAAILSRFPLMGTEKTQWDIVGRLNQRRVQFNFGLQNKGGRVHFGTVNTHPQRHQSRRAALRLQQFDEACSFTNLPAAPLKDANH